MDAMATATLKNNSTTANLTYREVYDAINGSYDPEIISDSRVGFRWNPHGIFRENSCRSCIPNCLEYGELDTSVFTRQHPAMRDGELVTLTFHFDEVVVMGPLEDLKNSGLPLEELSFKFEGEVLVCGEYYEHNKLHTWFWWPKRIKAWFDHKGQFHVKGQTGGCRLSQPPLVIDFAGTFQEWKDTRWAKFGGEISENLIEYAKTL